VCVRVFMRVVFVCVCVCVYVRVCVWQSKEARWHKSVRHDRRSIARGWWRRTCDIRCCCSCKGCRSCPRSVCMYIGGWVGHTHKRPSFALSLACSLALSLACSLVLACARARARSLARERALVVFAAVVVLCWRVSSYCACVCGGGVA